MTLWLSLLMAALNPAFADDGLFKMKICGEGNSLPKDYVPAFISNGSIATSIDNLGNQRQRAYYDIVPDVAWAGRRYSLPERSLFSFGHYDTKIKVDGVSLEKPEKWTQTLDTKNGYVEVLAEYGQADVKTVAFIVQGADILAVNKEVRTKNKNAKVEISFEYSMAEMNTGANPARMTVNAVAEKNRARFNYTAYGYSVYNGEISVRCDKPAKVEAASNSAVLTTARTASDGLVSASFFVSFADDYPAQKLDEKASKHAGISVYKNEVPDVEKTMETQKKIVSKGFQTVFDENKKAWLKKQNSSFIKADDVQMLKAYNTALYFLRSLKTKWSIPISLYSHGQHWNGAYFTWDNAFSVAGLCAAGDFETAKIAPEYRARMLPVAKYRVKHPSGDFGALYELSTREDGTSAAPQPTGFWGGHIFQNAAVASFCYRYYLFTNDREFLRGVYPVIRECAQYYLTSSIAKDEKGQTVVSKTLDLERLGTACPNPFMTSCGIIYNFETAVKCAKILGLEDEYTRKYEEAARELRKSLPNDGVKYVPRPDRNDKSIASIGGLFPFTIFDASSALQKNAAYDFAENIYEVGNMYPVGKNVCTWYYTWAAASMVALGDNRYPYMWIDRSSKNTGCFSEMWEIKEENLTKRPWFSTAAGSYIYSFCSMLLLNGDNGEIIIAPSVPDVWKNFSFNLPAYGNNYVNAEFKDGKIKKLKFTPMSESSDKNKTIVIAKKYVDASEKTAEWISDGDSWRIKVSGSFVYGE